MNTIITLMFCANLVKLSYFITFSEAHLETELCKGVSKDIGVMQPWPCSLGLSSSVSLSSRPECHHAIHQSWICHIPVIQCLGRSYNIWIKPTNQTHKIIMLQMYAKIKTQRRMNLKNYFVCENSVKKYRIVTGIFLSLLIP